MYKLSTSEVVVCNAFEEDPRDDFYIAKRPLQLMMSPGPEGFQMALLPWMSSETFIKKDSIIAITDAPPPVEQQYIKITTNIQIATNTPNIQLVR